MPLGDDVRVPVADAEADSDDSEEDLVAEADEEP